MEKTLAKLQETWKDIKFEFYQHRNTDIQLIRLTDENFDLLEENTNQASSMQSSRYIATFETEVERWTKSLSNITEILTISAEVQRNWAYLENLFLGSDEVKKELPEQAKQFVFIDQEVKRILKDASEKQYTIVFCDQDWVLKSFDNVYNQLQVCEKALNKFMAEKQKCFPRFYFTSSSDLLDILSNGNMPFKIMRFMSKIFQAIENLELKEAGERPTAHGMHTNVGVEYVEWTSPLKLMGKVENYMQEVINSMRNSLKEVASESLKRLHQHGKEKWLTMDPAQTTLLINMLNWTKDVETAFKACKDDNMAMKKAHVNQVKLLADLITMVQGDLSRPMRQKIGCMITMDAHSRDIIEQLHNEKVTNSEEFQWQSQLKVYYIDDDKTNPFILKIADAVFNYGYEYLGNGPRLVITPLTDRIYVTATQALHLCMGCAPAGPAGTGKTETTKDLSSALAKAIYVFNCSDQMDYKSMAGIFKGLAASGSWGCFDEFNRLVPEVLSVCSVQFKSVTDAIKAKKSRFKIEGDEMDLDPTCGAFITMNPGYIGRSELPEGLKALFRPITVVVPDLELICENMLMSEGFVKAKILAKKFTTLYFLCRDLLSKCPHYDWGLRAIKSVLVVAGSFKRAEPDTEELGILLRALRDFNTPKIISEDWEIFFGLLGDLFPGIEVARQRDMRFEDVILKTTIAQNLHPEEKFIRKVVELGELLVIRHCVFTMGPPGAGKSTTWKTLAKSQTADGLKTTIVDLNPKVVSTNELYGVCDPKTRDWKDGLMSNRMRSLSEEPDNNPKWIALDGDLDANWIESMNSVMDDNKLLTLASNERIVLKPSMRLIFEIRNLKFATPATVSRAGILYISDFDGYQWRAYVKSWIAAQKYDAERKKDLQTLFDKYIDESLKHIKKTFKYTVPVLEIQLIMTVCKLLEAILATQEIKGLEYIFVFCCVWCLGGGFSDMNGINYRRNFSDWWKDKWKIVKFPAKGTVFDYYIDIEANKPEEWIKMQTKDISDTLDTSKPIQNFTVPTTDTISTQFLMKKFIGVNISPMLVGNAGCGKTQITKGLLNDMTQNGDDYLQQTINFNYYTDSTLLQSQLESLLEKKAGKTYAPLGKYKLLQFIDDLNMPQQDSYETQTAISLLRQHKDYEHWYERGTKWAIRDIKNTQYIASMNPTAGSFFVDPRLQRWFWIAAIPFPEQSSLNTIFAAFLNKHFSKFKGTIQELVPQVIKAALTLHSAIESNFRKTAANFHYEFNVRHLTNIFQGLLVARPEAIKEPDNLIKLWVHESERIYGDRLVNAEHLVQYRALAADIVKKQFGKFNLNKYFQQPTPEPLIFAYFVGGLDDKLYDQFAGVDALSGRLRDALREYNELNAAMDLVLFDDAMKHVCKISRIISCSSGHSLLVGVGGSGKQSLSRLASSICQFRTVGIMISSTYGLNELKADLQNFYNRAGCKDEGLMFLFNEGQITNERFLVSLNDLLSSGEISDLFNDEDIEGIVNSVRAAVKGEGIVDNKDNCYKFFLDRVRKNLHMSLCFSPVGDGFRNRARKFPALINCTVIDWFHPWPEDALLSVASKFLDEVEMPSDEVRKSVVNFMPFSFKCVNVQSDIVYNLERRYVYTTPKSFLELIKLFKGMLSKKVSFLQNAKEKYELGVIKLNDTSTMVAELEASLKVSSVEVEKIKKVADEQAKTVGAEKEIVDAEAEKANAESAKCAIIAKNVSEEMASVQKDLDAALPAVEKAEAALAGLNVKDFQMLKALANPPAPVAQTFTCVLHLLAGIDPNVQVDKKGKLNAENPWKNALKLMANPQKFLDVLNEFKQVIDEDRVKAQNFAAIKPTLDEEGFNVETIKSKSSAAGGLCDWIININTYYLIVVSVEPKKLKVAQAKEELATANEKKETMENMVAELEAKLAILQADF
jgi:dynein heavy chain, axonemal